MGQQILASDYRTIARKAKDERKMKYGFVRIRA
jgi:hypothetical protein